ncbi:flagellar hook-length control protein FliK [Bacillus tianshenii]|nr:flagellar hook-length control protein FliK [Bacillus tianshenii]
MFLGTTQVGEMLHAKQQKVEGTARTEVEASEAGEFHRLLSENISTLLEELTASPAGLGKEMALHSEISNTLKNIEDLEELLHLEISLLNSLEEELSSEEYFGFIHQFLELSSTLTQIQQQQAVPAEMGENVFERMAMLTNKLLLFTKEWKEGKSGNSQPQNVKQQADLKELMILIEKKFAKIFQVTEKQTGRTDTANVKSFPFQHFISENVSVGPISINHLQQPKPATVQWVVDTSTNQVARDQLIQKLEGILSKSQTSFVNGNQQITIRLTPEHLGTLHIKLQETQHGLVAKLVAHSKSSATLLESGLATLKQNLVNANIPVDKIEVVYQEQEPRFFQQGRNQEEQQAFKDSSANGRKEKEPTEKSFDEILSEEIDIKDRAGEGQ